MQIGMIGLGRMGSNMVQRLMKNGHSAVVFDARAQSVEELANLGATGSSSLEDFVSKLEKPRAVWMMLPAAIVDAELTKLVPLLEEGDIIIDGGNSYYHDDIRRAAMLKQKGIHYVDVGTSGGVFGLQRGYCLMIGGETPTVQHLSPIFATLAPGVGDVKPSPQRTEVAAAKSTAEQGFLHCGPHGAGHFVKMVHNGIEYGLMAAYAEGLNILKHANIGMQKAEIDAETAPLSNPEFYQYNIDIAEVSEVWRRGSVITSWLLDLTADALHADAGLTQYAGRVSDSGEGRWTISAAIDEGVPTPVLSAALYGRFSSRGNDDFANQILSAMRAGFGGHHEKPAAK
ncbi:decarboxylating 6-phosphogluconate dehydrogenase [Neorhizobium sp. P12A]|jgi:6-phosphogluconate dehydrogenase|uniref:phosphogluconate dehydrogenase (NAD(+)-dependent, decarboxylating) n=1 Tax=Rhizobium/Agrobacterium group TaxID=227290 RepID=UPI00104A2B8D|nr:MULTISPECIES: decarboxylating 6-phosphogluconate dehydrogenase [Rhizobium/Agrobacterium group]KAA0697456.1 decarboxylating 6-phosphogluconate dehydrogenase [Neorhizobium sp. P12A]TCR82235.1 6-phosphogluconate dehydrogenase (decarboxylating) [Rhizobium sp. BK376]